MFKKMIAVGAVSMFFACSGSDDESENPGQPSSSSLTGTSSSSAIAVIDTIPVTVSAFNAAASQTFGTYPYGFTKKGEDEEDLTAFWDIGNLELDCLEAAIDTVPPPACELDKTNAMLQNKLTNQYSALHYVINGFSIGYPNQAIKLTSYNLTEEGDQAALGIDLGADANKGKNLEELGEAKSQLFDGTVAFAYRYWGGAHEFRAVSKNDDDFWVFSVPAKTDTSEVKIFLDQFEGMGSFAADEEGGIEGEPFDILKVAKFLWVVEFDTEVPGNNQGSLLVDYLNALVEREQVE